MTFDERLPRVSPEPKAAIALNFPELKLGDVVDCGVPPGDSFRNPLTNVTKLWTEGLIALGFDKRSAQDQVDMLAIMSTIGMGLFLSSFVLAAIFLCLLASEKGCCEDCCDDTFENWTAERRKKSAGARQGDAIDVVEGGEENANDFENGILTRYTCAYGLGPFMKRFVFMVKGETMAGEAQRDDKWPVNFE